MKAIRWVSLWVLVALGSGVPSAWAGLFSGLTRDLDCEPAATDFRVALSVSSFAEFVLSSGITYRDGGIEATDLESLQQLFVRYGATEVFSRLGTVEQVNTPADRTLAGTLRRATVAHSLGLSFNPEVSLFGTYGDVSCQTPPEFAGYPDLGFSGEWTDLTLEEMLPILEAYGELIAQTILDTGVTVNVWDLGNEIEYGTAGVAVAPIPGACDNEAGPNWYQPPDNVDPDIGTRDVISLFTSPVADQIAWLNENLWPYEAQLLKAVADGIREVDPNARFATHIANSHSAEFAVAFYEAMSDGGMDFDELGLSFYPSSPLDLDLAGRIDAFKATVTALNTTFGKPVFVAEYAYPASRILFGPFSNWDNKVPGYSLRERGQAQLLRDLTAWGSENGLSGIRPWAPDFVNSGIPIWNAMALFQKRGNKAKPRSGMCSILYGLEDAAAP